MYESSCFVLLLFFIFFFFKQKTAYEMRISDWSSDVCSSDLIAAVLACMLFAALSGSSPATVAAVGSIAIAGMVRSGYPQSFGAEIGRASCRERVCQYV